MEVRRTRAARPHFALRLDRLDQPGTKDRCCVLWAFTQQVDIFAADDRGLHAVVAQLGKITGQQLALASERRVVALETLCNRQREQRGGFRCVSEQSYECSEL